MSTLSAAGTQTVKESDAGSDNFNLDENVRGSALTDARVPVREHDADRLCVHGRKIEHIQCTSCCKRNHNAKPQYKI